jgi:hypothetical protein
MESEVDISPYPMNNQQRRSREPPDKTLLCFEQFWCMMNKVPTMATNTTNREADPTYMMELSIENGIIDSIFTLSSTVHDIGDKTLLRFKQFWFTMFLFMMNKEVPTMAKNAINQGPTYMAELNTENGVESTFSLDSAVHYIGRSPLMMMLLAFESGTSSRKHREELETMMLLPSQQEPSDPLNHYLLDWSLALTCDPG